MKTIKTTLATIWIIWIALLVCAILFASTPIDLNITNTTAATLVFYGLTFGLPLAYLAVNNFKNTLRKSC